MIYCKPRPSAFLFPSVHDQGFGLRVRSHFNRTWGMARASVSIEIEKINEVSDLDKKLIKQIRSSQTSIIRLLEKQLKLVPINYYRTTWLALGMTAFVIPLGVAYGSITGNMAFIGIGLPIGMALGIAVGTGMDKKAMKEGRQLDIKVKP